MSKPAAEFIPLNIAILTVSDSRTIDEDSSGQYLVDHLTAAGHHLADRQLITDDIYKIRAVMSGWIADARCLSGRRVHRHFQGLASRRGQPCRWHSAFADCCWSGMLTR